MHAPLRRHGATGRNQCLTGDLPTEDPHRGLQGADAAEDVVLNALKIQ